MFLRKRYQKDDRKGGIKLQFGYNFFEKVTKWLQNLLTTQKLWYIIGYS